MNTTKEEALKNHNSTRNQQIKDKLVDREVRGCASCLIREIESAMRDMNTPEFGGLTYDDLMPMLLSEPDYEEAASQAGWVEADEGDSFFHESEGTVFADDWKELCEMEDIDTDDYRSEVFEHWIVSSWMGEKLEEHGQAVLEVCGLTIWGRCTTGQSIALDWVIGKIASEMGILEGQRNEWSV